MSMINNIVMMSSKKELPYVKKDVKVFFFAGQSNMYDRYPSMSNIKYSTGYSAYWKPMPNVFYLNACDSISNTGGVFKPYDITQLFPVYGTEFMFLQKLSEAHPDSLIYAVKFAVGSSALKQLSGVVDWNQASTNEHYNNFFVNSSSNSICQTAMTHINTIHAKDNVSIKAVCWVQGEEDANQASTTYLADLNALVNGIRGQFGANVKFVYNRLIYGWGAEGSAQLIRDAQTTFDSQSALNIMVNGDDLPVLVPPDLHFSPEGLLILGERLGDAYLTI